MLEMNGRKVEREGGKIKSHEVELSRGKRARRRIARGEESEPRENSDERAGFRVRSREREEKGQREEDDEGKVQFSISVLQLSWDREKHFPVYLLCRRRKRRV